VPARLLHGSETETLTSDLEVDTTVMVEAAERFRACPRHDPSVITRNQSVTLLVK
jgi:hypothetical protein